MFFKKKSVSQKVNDFLIDHNLPAKKSASKVKWVVIFFIAAIIIFWLIFGPLLATGIKLVGKVNSANYKVELIKENIGSGKWMEAEKSMDELTVLLSESRADMHRIGIVGYLPAVKRNIKAVDKILLAMEDLLSGYNKIFELFATIDDRLKTENLSLGFGTPQQKKEFLNGIKENKVAFIEAQKLIDSSSMELEGIKNSDFPAPIRDKMISFVSLLRKTIASTETALPIVSNLPELLGSGQEKTYLFLFQNNMEIRPTGGFIGSYGLVTVKDGEIINIFTDDVYNLDKLSIGKLNAVPPQPMIEYNNQKNWFLRDANWSPDWPTSAQQILWFFNEERKNAHLPPQQIDGVIGLTPEFVSNLLGVIGPVMVDGILFKSEGFANDLEQFVEFDYVEKGIEDSKRKSIMGPLTQIIVNSLHRLSPESLIDVWSAFKNNIDQKNILVYLADPNLQQYFLAKNWSGSINPTDGDFLMIVDSNFAALKTDQVMNRAVDYSIRPDGQGNLIAHLEIVYKHEGKYTPGIITNYRDYLRIYVPKDTWFISGKVVDDKESYDLEFGKNSEIKNDLNKKYLATYFTVNPGFNKTIVVEYKLPEYIKNLYDKGLYKLIVQKQPGTIGHNLKINLNFTKNISAYLADIAPTVFSGNSMAWETDLSVDREIKLGF